LRSSRSSAKVPIKFLIGIVVICLGLVIGVLAAIKPITSSSQEHAQLSTPLDVDPNDYKTESLTMAKGETVSFSLQLDNQSIFRLYLMNSTQIPIFAKCAPKCMQPLLGGTGSYYRQAGLTRPALILNVSVTEATPYAGNFTAPSSGIYYFVFDNSVGPVWQDYLSQNATGSATGNFRTSVFETTEAYSLNWQWVLLGAGEMAIGGVVASVFWQSRVRQVRVGRLQRFNNRFGMVIALLVIAVILVADVPVFMSSARSLGLSSAGSSGNNQTGSSTTSVVFSNYSLFEIDDDYLSNVGPTGFGSLSVDNPDQLLYVASKANNSIYTYDLPDEAEYDIGGFNYPVSVQYVPQFGGKLFVSNAGNGTVDIMSVNYTGYPVQLQRISELDFPNPGSFGYDATNGIMYVGFGSGNESGLGVISASTDTELGTISLAGQPGQLVVEQNGSRVFVTIPSLGMVQAIDSTTREVINSWNVSGATENVAIALDETSDRLFVASDDPPSLKVLDDNTGDQVASFNLPSPPGDVSFDPESGLIMATCTGGTVEVYQELNASYYFYVTSQPSGPMAGVSVFYPQQELVYVAIPPSDGQPSQLMTFAIYSD
jgi:hypothetical protein